MKLQMVTVTTAQTRKELRRQFIAAACGTAITLAALAGIAVWRATAHGRTSGAAAPQAHGPSAIATARTVWYSTLYLVASQEDAERWESRMLREPGVDPTALGFAVVSSPEEETRVWQEVDAGQIFAASSGRSVPRLVDLRPREDISGNEKTAPGE